MSPHSLSSGTSRQLGAAVPSRSPFVSFSRSLALGLSLGTLALLSACGGGNNFNAAAPGGDAPPADNSPALHAPAALAYDEPEVLYMSGDAITANRPGNTGGEIDSYAIAPALPAGLELDARSGEIRGTPTAVTAYAPYTVTGSNAAGATSAKMRIEVTARGNWVPAGLFGMPRYFPTASLLQDGRVLVAGGNGGGGTVFYGDADIYEPTLGTWTPATPMLSPRTGHTATVLPDGRVLVVGGDISRSSATSTAELYNPATNTWTATSSMARARRFHTATLLPTGEVLVLGGSHSDPGGTLYPDTAETFNPATGTWTTLATRLAEPRVSHAAELLPGGTHVLVAGGSGSAGMVPAELFPVDGGTSTVLSGGPLGAIAQSVSLADGSVLVTTHQTTAWRFDPATSSWRSSSLSTSRQTGILTRLADGRALLAGDPSSDTADIYNPGVNRWTSAASTATARGAAAMTRLRDGSVLAVGGTNLSGDVGTAERYEP